jgi:hypothetical protein
MCGKDNPAGQEICVYCGSRLFPLDFTGQPGEPQDKAEAPFSGSDDDPLASLRAQYGDSSIGAQDHRPDAGQLFGADSQADNLEVPDWLLEPVSPEEIPEWLAETTPAPPGSDEEPSIDEALEWLTGSGAPAAVPSDEPGWGFTPEPQTDIPGESETGEGIPDWLAQLDKEKGAPQPALREPDVAGETLRPISDDQPVPPPLIDTGMPDWLHPASATSDRETGPAEWPGEAGEPEPPPAQLPDIPPPAAEEEALPDWSGEPGALEVDEAGALSWLEELAGEPETAGEQPAEDGDALAWLDELVQAEPALEEAAEPAVPERAGEFVPEQAPPPEEEDWFADIDLDTELGPSSLESGVPVLEGEDLLGLSSDVVVSAAEAISAEAVEVDESEMPAWMRELKEDQEAPAASREAQPSSDLASQIADLRYEAVTGRREEGPSVIPETIGALRDVSGVIQPELIFEGSSLTVTAPVDQVVVTEEQIPQVELLNRLLARESEAVQVEGRRGALPVLRWFVALLLIAAIAVPWVLGITILAEPAPASADLVTIHNTVNALGGSPSTVLIVFDYEPDAAAEMRPLAEAVLAHLGEQDSATVYIVSTRPIGPSMAEDVLQTETVRNRLADNGGTWVNLGYIAGHASGIYEFTTGTAHGIPSVANYNYAGNAALVETQYLQDGTINLIFVITDSFEDLRSWVEQAGRLTGIPMIGVLSARTAPLAQAYRDSGQLLAVMNGIDHAVQYRTLSGLTSSDETLLATWNAQALAGTLAAGLIVIGGFVFGIAAARERQEQDR